MRAPKPRKIWIDRARWRETMQEVTSRARQRLSSGQRSRDRSGWDRHRTAVARLLWTPKQLGNVLDLWGERLSANERKIIGAFVQAGTFRGADKILKRKRSQYQPIREAVSHLVVLASGLEPARGYRVAVNRFKCSDAGLPWDDDD